MTLPRVPQGITRDSTRHSTNGNVSPPSGVTPVWGITRDSTQGAAGNHALLNPAQHVHACNSPRHPALGRDARHHYRSHTLVREGTERRPPASKPCLLQSPMSRRGGTPVGVASHTPTHSWVW